MSRRFILRHFRRYDKDIDRNALFDGPICAYELLNRNKMNAGLMDQKYQLKMGAMAHRHLIAKVAFRLHQHSAIRVDNA